MLLNYLHVFVYAQLFRSFVALTSNDVLNVTILLDVRDGPTLISRAGAGFLVALETVQKKKLLANYTIQWKVADMGCSVRALDRFIPLWKEFAGGIHAVIGPSCSDACRSIGLFTAAFHIPEVSHYCTSNALSKRSIYKMFARTVGDKSADIPRLVLMAAMKFGWRNFHIIATRWSPWFRLASNIKVMLDNTTLLDADLDITSNVHIVGAYRRFIKDVENVLEDIKQQNNPALIILSVYKESAFDIVRVARDKQLSRNAYAFLLIDQLQIDLTETEMLKLLNGTLSVGYGTGLFDVFERFQMAAFTAYKKEPQIQALFDLSSPSQVTIEDALLHDAFLLWAFAANKTIQQNRPLSEGAWNGSSVAASIPHIAFNGASGFVTLTPNGDRVANYTLGVIYQGQVITILIQQNSTGKWDFLTEGLRQIGWHNKLRLIPGVPLHDSSGLELKMITFWVVLMALTSASVFVIICSKFQSEAELKSIQFLMLDHEKLRVSPVLRQSMAHHRSFHSKSESERLIPTLTVVAAASHSPSQDSSAALPNPTLALAKTSYQPRTTYFGYYEDMKISIKVFSERRTISVKDRKLCMEFLQLWKLNHPNINNFIGACVVVPNVFLCRQYCSRGSVSDIIQQKTIKLTPEFRLALAIDIAQGMKHLHLSQIGSHGHLTSTNCVVDDQWTCKITDHGLCEFRAEYLNPVDGDKETDRLLWTAPELLNLVPRKRPICGSQTADVYSYGIILQELRYQALPFGELCQSLGSKTIVSRVKAGEEPPFRPLQAFEAASSNLGFSPLWTILMENCWNQDPMKRPPFSEIIPALINIGGGKMINPVETVIQMLEEHTQKLEEIVHERSELLYEEKKKAEQLLYSVLPIQVAEELKQGNIVYPEEFKSVTIYVSDIVEFTPLAAKSSAIEVVHLLSILFDMFDKLIEKFGVYKLETIGDAYVVAGGLPKRNGDLHATQIASLALHILSSIFTFKIPHLPERPLQIRTGIHTGPVVAGVAGVKMPRYCLFGATVNTAFTMESIAKPMTINVSNSTAQLLLSNNLFKLEKLRLQVNEGDRKIAVYQLLSMHNLNLPMPVTA